MLHPRLILHRWLAVGFLQGGLTLLPAGSVPGLTLAEDATTRTVRVSAASLATGLRPAVAIITPPAWSPNDPVRDGAVEFEVLFTTARLLQDHPLAGLVAVGNRHGVLPPATESSLRRSVHLGLPVVRLADGGTIAAPPDDLLIRGGNLRPEEARALLLACLARHGTLSPAADPERPTARERAAWRRQLAAYQREFDAHLAAVRTAREGLAVAVR